MRNRSNNPVYGKIVDSQEYRSFSREYAAATYGGVAKKTLFFLALVFIGIYGGLALMQRNPEVFVTALVISLPATFIFALLGFLFPHTVKLFGSLYCLSEGMLIGVISLAFEVDAPGIVLTALLSVVIVLAVSVTLFMTNLVKVNRNFLRFLLVFAVSFICSNFLMLLIDFLFKTSFYSIFLLPLSLISTFLATLYLFFDFQRAYMIVEGGAPKEMEWYVSFGLVYTLVWIYIEILRLIWLFKSND
ncbi:MAG: Bax inhibitor-1/YccA family protein [Bacilli bacterium]|nr:Bax inhibitor-1/YccA family protein [Bacilli bacterium]